MVTEKNVALKVATKTTNTGNDLKISEVKAPLIIPEKRPSARPTIEQRIKKFEEIQELLDRREVVAEAIQNLAGFYIAPNGSSCNLRLQDSKGKTFAIAHPSVIGEMVAMAKEKLSAELARIEDSIDFTI